MSAVFSPCRQYRYRLSRQFGMGDRTVAFVGVNPSIADEAVNDATIRKMCGFAMRWGFDRIEVVNLFAWRSTDVRQLAHVADPVGPENDMRIVEALADAHRTVVCWGSLHKLPLRLCGRVLEVRDLIAAAGVDLCQLGTTKNGDPRHPLMLSYETKLEPWS